MMEMENEIGAIRIIADYLASRLGITAGELSTLIRRGILNSEPSEALLYAEVYYLISEVK